MNNNVIILKDIVTMSDSEDQDVKIQEEKSDVNPIEETIEDAMEKTVEEPADKTNLIEPSAVKPDKKINTDDIKVSQEDFEQALEKVIKKLFADKIDPILEKTIEEVVSKEIKIIEQSLTE